MAPMTRNFSPRGVPGPDVAAYYRRRAEGGGLIFTEGTSPNHPQAANMPQIPHLYGAEALAGWGRVVEGVHAAGGRIFSQIWHVGAVQGQTEPKLPACADQPVGLLKPGVKIGEPMTLGEIEAMIEAYAQAAANAQCVGFDGIELHGAHGYLIDQFFWEARTSARTNTAATLWGARDSRSKLFRSAAGGRSEFPYSVALLAVEAARLRRAPGYHAGRAVPFPGAAGHGRARCISLLDAPILGP